MASSCLCPPFTVAAHGHPIPNCCATNLRAIFHASPAWMILASTGGEDYGRGKPCVNAGKGVIMPDALGLGLIQIDPQRGANWRAGEIQDVARAAEDAG